MMQARARRRSRCSIRNSSSGLPAGMRWSPVRGCQHPLGGVVTQASPQRPFGGGREQRKTTAAIQCTPPRPPPSTARTPVPVGAEPRSPPTSGSSPPPPQRPTGEGRLTWTPSVKPTPTPRLDLAGRVLRVLMPTRVLDAVTPAGGEFDPKSSSPPATSLLARPGRGRGASAALVAAIHRRPRRGYRGRSCTCGARLDPRPAAHAGQNRKLEPLAVMPTLMARRRGYRDHSGAELLQSLAQAREKWGENKASAIWDAAIVKIILGGASSSRDLQDLSTLIGNGRDHRRDRPTPTSAHSNQRSIRRVLIILPSILRALPFGTGVVMLRTARPIITRLRPWTARPGAASSAPTAPRSRRTPPARFHPSPEATDGAEGGDEEA